MTDVLVIFIAYGAPLDLLGKPPRRYFLKERIVRMVGQERKPELDIYPVNGNLECLFGGEWVG